MAKDFKLVKKGDWAFSQYKIAPTVVIAENKLKWYDEERIAEIVKRLEEERCRVFVNLLTDDESRNNYKRKRCRLEVYKKYNTQSLEEKIDALGEILSSINFEKNV